MPFTVREPTQERPLIVEVPHAGLVVDPLSMATLAAPVRCLGQDADLYVDELYARAPELGATLLVAHESRYVCDLNRDERDIDAGSVALAQGSAHPHGLIWRLTTDGKPALVAPLSNAEYQRRLDAYYRPYHATLSALIRRKVERFGYVVVLAAHSMPSSGRVGHRDPGTPRAQIVPGSRGRTSAHGSVIDIPDVLAATRGWSVCHDQPYRGGFTTAHYGRPKERVHLIQVELNRSLYMNELTLERLPAQFDATRVYCEDLVSALASVPSGPLCN